MKTWTNQELHDQGFTEPEMEHYWKDQQLQKIKIKVLEKEAVMLLTLPKP